ncbi:hypothetical protein TSEDIMI_130066 [Tenacibaculum sediminilitoris]|uniref:cadherin domain-containing protein n=1 Tax=Tenacibaculum sediminilitoris TaxID=1820334 RepID=UPI0038938444
MRVRNYLKLSSLALLILTACDKKEEELNTAPVIENQVFEVLENITSNQKFADIVATDIDKDELLFSIVENDAGLFQISGSGELSVSADKGLDYETKTEHKITVEVSDGDKKSSAGITIKVTDVDENEAPIIENQTFTVAEDILDTDIIGTVSATDPNGDDLSYTVSDANFEITGSGELSLIEGKQFDYETKTEHKLTVEVSDGAKSASAEITINITDVDENEAPVIENQTFTVAEDILSADIIGKVVATDDITGTRLKFVMKADADNLFRIFDNGTLYLIDGKKLDYETKTSHTITVEVSDGEKTATADITIKVTDVVEGAVVNIPDTNFKEFLVGNNSINTNRDTEIQVSEAESYTEVLNLGGKNIRDLTGIEYFTNITQLWIFDNKLTTIDLSKNVKLKKLYTYNNTLTSLNLSKNILLEELYCHRSGLENLNITTNTKLRKLICYGNFITNINLANNLELEYIDLSDNKLTSIDVAQNIKLKSLVSRKNSITELDITKNSLLELLYIRSNNITSLNLNNNAELTSLELLDNKLTSLDVSKNLKMSYLSCGGNFITNLDLSNNKLLKNLQAANNQLTSITLPESSSLEDIYLSQNKLTTIDVSKIDKLRTFKLDENELTSVNLSNNASLSHVILYNNKNLTKINVANGNNAAINSFVVTNNPNLTCIQIDSGFTPDTTKWAIDNGVAKYSYTACP